MDKLIDYVCDELETLEKKAEKGNLSMSEIEYADKLAHLKKNLLKGEEMMEEGYSGGMYPDMRMRDGRMYSGRDYSGARRYSKARGRGSNAKRDSMGRYSSEYSMDSDEFRGELEELMQSAPNDHVRQKLQRIMTEM